jgi:signal transduction histidine kinase
VEQRFARIGEVELDKHRVLQILINLISNAKHAVKANKSSNKRIALVVEKGRDQRVRFKVSDNGVGIASQNLARIFSMGFTTRSEGHGFGLHSAANAAKEMGGSLTVESDGEGKGATFTLEIPLVPQEQGAACKR